MEKHNTPLALVLSASMVTFSNPGLARPTSEAATQIKPSRVFEVDGQQGPCCLAFSPDGTRLAIVVERSLPGVKPPIPVLLLLDPLLGEGHARLDLRDNFPKGRYGYERLVVTFSPDSKWVAVGHPPGPDIWDPATRQRGNSPAFEPRKPRGVTIWDPTSGQTVKLPPATPPDVPLQVGSLAFSPDGKLLAVAEAGKGTIELWDWAASKMVLSIKPGRRVDKIAFSPDGKVLASHRITPSAAPLGRGDR